MAASIHECMILCVQWVEGKYVLTESMAPKVPQHLLRKNVD